jgi:hypothetical protein
VVVLPGVPPLLLVPPELLLLLPPKQAPWVHAYPARHADVVPHDLKQRFRAPSVVVTW